MPNDDEAVKDGSGNVYADLGSANAKTLKIKADIVSRMGVIAKVEIDACEGAENLPDQDHRENAPPAKQIPVVHDIGALVFELLKQKINPSWHMNKPWIIHQNGGLSTSVTIGLYILYIAWFVPLYLSA